MSGTDNGAVSINAKDPDNEGDSINKDNSSHPPYTVNAVLHFLQHELNRYEMERAHWEMEKAELRARIKFLNGERKGQEELKRDLVRRIKMLEYSLKQERLKCQRIKGEVQPELPAQDDQYVHESFTPIEVDATLPNIQHSRVYTQARTLLRTYLEEIGYSEKILDVRSFRVKNLLGFTPETNGPNSGDAASNLSNWSSPSKMAENDIMPKNKRFNEEARKGESDSDVEDRGNLDMDAVTALDEFAFLKDEKGTFNETIEYRPVEDDQKSTIEKMKEKLRMEQRKRSNSNSGQDSTDTQLQEKDRVDRGLTAKDIMGFNMIAVNDDINIKDDFAETGSDNTTAQWRIRFTLRSHLDCVRSMIFHPFEPVLITASEDGTAKMWNLSEKVVAENLKSSHSSHSTMGIVDVEPRYSFRGHKGEILSMDLSSTGEMFFTGGLDGTVCCWELPDFNIPIYDHYDRKLLTERLRGHTGSVWSVVYHSSSNRIISGSSDGTIRLWELGVNRSGDYADPQLQCFNAPLEGSRPRSLDLVSTETHQLLTAYSGKYAGILDLETGKRTLEFGLKELDEEVGEINKIISHPTMPVTITGGTDRRIRYFDNNTGKLIRSSVAHVESISTLACDPNGLCMLSGCDDGSLRLWNMETRVCMQEIAAHRKKYDMSVMAVAFHPSRPLIGSAGADSLVKVFSSQTHRDLGSTTNTL